MAAQWLTGLRSGLWCAALVVSCTLWYPRALSTVFGAEPAETPAVAAEGVASEADLKFYREAVEPILSSHCFKCHGDGKARGGLSLADREWILRGGDSGPAVDEAQPADSLLIAAIEYRGYEMPPEGKLPPDQIDVLKKWVERGLPMPPSEGSAAIPQLVVPQVNDETRGHWAFRPVQVGLLPEVSEARWSANPIDRWIRARQQELWLEPAGRTDPQAWFRRVTYDLTGLPPTPEQVAEFLNDPSESAREAVVDRLLASPQYGEKWGRFWLDLVRYAETNGFERDNAKPNAWKYRDYVVEAFNSDKPLDRFLREQLAGDELPDADSKSIIATGFYRLGQWDDEPANREQAFYDELDDMVSTVGQVCLGLTIGCARCHDHKLDPLPQKDYYRLLAFLQDVPGYLHWGNPDGSSASQTDLSPPELRERHARREAAMEQARAAILEIEQAGIKRMPGKLQRETEGHDRQKVLDEHLARYLDESEWGRHRELVARLKELESTQLPPREMALSVNGTLAEPRPTFVLIRGTPGAHGPQVQPGFPEVLLKAGFDPEQAVVERSANWPAPPAGKAGRRRILADWVASPDNPLTARVWVNRLWQQHFGRGLVKSASNFGLKGDRPTHPELLDWLAGEFVRGGMRSKPLQRLIVLSETYGLAATPVQGAAEVDPLNDGYTSFEMRRLTAEELRDSVLAVTGRLNLAMGGPSVYPRMPDVVLQGQSVPGNGWYQGQEAYESRRSLYTHIKRSLVPPLLAVFDFPETESSCAVRFATTQPTQALSLLNSEWMQEQGRAFARRLIREAGDQPRAQAARGLSLVLQREPSAGEVDRGVRLMESLQLEEGLSAEEALAGYALVLLNLNEFVFLD